MNWTNVEAKYRVSTEKLLTLKDVLSTLTLIKSCSLAFSDTLHEHFLDLYPTVLTTFLCHMYWTTWIHLSVSLQSHLVICCDGTRCITNHTKHVVANAKKKRCQDNGIIKTICLGPLQSHISIFIWVHNLNLDECTISFYLVWVLQQCPIKLRWPSLIEELLWNKVAL